MKLGQSISKASFASNEMNCSKEGRAEEKEATKVGQRE